MSQRIDDAARALARPVSRRAAMRVLGASVLGALLPATAARRAFAGDGWPVVCAGGAYRCHAGDKCCGGTCCQETDICCNDGNGGWCCPPPEDTAFNGAPVRRFCGDRNPYSCREEVGCPPRTTPCGKGSGAYLYAACCDPGYECRDGRCVAGCPRGRQRCGKRCCEKGEECVGGRCRRRCPTGRVRCGGRCCPKGHRCKDPRRGVCERCPSGKQPCGKRCCPKSSYCCGDANGGTCCPRKGGSCCSNRDARGRAQHLCCRRPTRCARPVAIGASGAASGVDTAGRYSCCPEERYVERFHACCPPGHVSLGGAFVLPPGGGGGLCCRKDKLCGSGDSRTCCGTGSAAFPELDQTCCGGRCVSTAADPANCGGCGIVCPPGQRCQGGACIPA